MFEKVFQQSTILPSITGKTQESLGFVLKLLMFIICITPLTACTLKNARDSINEGQVGRGFIKQTFPTSHFTLFGMLRPSTASVASNILHVYIEGDGWAWVSGTRPSTDPTPITPVALQVAQADPSSNAVLYLARPYQYIPPNTMQHSLKYWTGSRFAPEVIDSMSEAIDAAKLLSNTSHVVLVGFSGGGAVAALLAAQRHDVIFMGSIAGNLDHRSWTQMHNVTPLHNSLNPIDKAYALRRLAQRHLSSSTDTIIPPDISRKFCRAIENDLACIRISGVSHEGPWENIWDYTYPTGPSHSQ